MSVIKDAPAWMGAIEWAKGSPMRRVGVERLDELRRLQLAAVMSSGELSDSERRLVEAYRSPLDMAGWALAGVSHWGLDEATAPMRAWERAAALRELLDGAVGTAQAARDWKTDARGGYRASDKAELLRPSNAFTLMFKRHRLPGLAGAAVLSKGAISFPLAGACGWLALSGAHPALWIATGASAAIAKIAETAFFKGHDKGGRVELMAMRAAMASKKRVGKLGLRALAQARALKGAETETSPPPDALDLMGQAKEFAQEAMRLNKQAARMSQSSVMEALERADEITRLKEKASELLSRAKEQEQKASKQSRALDYDTLRQVLGNFSLDSPVIRGMVARAWDVEGLRQKALSSKDRLELENAVPNASAAPKKTPRV